MQKVGTSAPKPLEFRILRTTYLSEDVYRPRPRSCAPSRIKKRPASHIGQRRSPPRSVHLPLGQSDPTCSPLRVEQLWAYKLVLRMCPQLLPPPLTMRKRSVSNRAVYDSGLRLASEREPKGIPAIEHYLELADLALGLKKPEHDRPRRSHALKPPAKHIS